MRVDMSALRAADDGQTLGADNRGRLDRRAGIRERVLETPAVGAGEPARPGQAGDRDPHFTQQLAGPLLAKVTQLGAPQADRTKTLSVIRDRLVVEVPAKRRQMVDR